MYSGDGALLDGAGALLDSDRAFLDGDKALLDGDGSLLDGDTALSRWLMLFHDRKVKLLLFHVLKYSKF